MADPFAQLVLAQDVVANSVQESCSMREHMQHLLGLGSVRNLILDGGIFVWSTHFSNLLYSRKRSADFLFLKQPALHVRKLRNDKHDRYVVVQNPHRMSCIANTCRLRSRWVVVDQNVRFFPQVAIRKHQMKLGHGREDMGTECLRLAHVCMMRGTSGLMATTFVSHKVHS